MRKIYVKVVDALERHLGNDLFSYYVAYDHPDNHRYKYTTTEEGWMYLEVFLSKEADVVYENT